MAKLKTMAEEYQPQMTNNIADLDQVSVDVEVEEEERQDKDGKPYKQNVAIIKGVRYRVPDSVLEQLQALLKKLPSLKVFCVLKSGSGMNTKYQVLPAEEKK